MRKLLIGTLLTILIASFLTSIYLLRSSSSSEKEIKKMVISQSLIPSKTVSGADLSYILVVSEDDVNISLFNSSGYHVGMAKTIKKSERSPIIPTAEALFEQPESGTYTVKVSARSLYKIFIFLYDRDGEVYKQEFHDDKEHNYLIIFDKENVKNSTITQ